VKSYKSWGQIQTKQQHGFKQMLEGCWKCVLNMTAWCHFLCYLKGIHSHNLISSNNCKQFLYLILIIISRIIAQIIVHLKIYCAMQVKVLMYLYWVTAEIYISNFICHTVKVQFVLVLKYNAMKINRWARL
jgi:hypothetical protein